MLPNIVKHCKICKTYLKYVYKLYYMLKFYVILLCASSPAKTCSSLSPSQVLLHGCSGAAFLYIISSHSHGNENSNLKF